MTTKTPRKPKNLKEDQASENAASIAMKPTNKAEAISAAVNLMGIMPQDMAINCFQEMIKQMQYSAENIPDYAAQNAAGIQMKPSAAMAESAIEAIFGDDKDLSEEFRQKAVTLFEAQLSARLVLEREQMKAELDELYEEQFAESVENLIENIDEYITYVAKEWMKENQVAVESTLRNENAEEFMAGMKALFDEHYISVPEKEVSLVDELSRKIETLEQRLNGALKENFELTQMNEEFYKNELVDELGAGLVATEREKLRALCEDFEVNDQLVDKIKLVMERHFGIKAPKDSNLLNESFEQPKEEVVADRQMAAYIDAATKIMR